MDATVDNPRAFLESELMRRIGRNPRYSLRSFAKSLGVSHTILSLVLAGKRPPSKNLLARLADILPLPPDQRERLMAGAPASKRSGATAKALAASYQKLQLDHFNLIAEWYHYAILSLLDLPGARFEAKWIAGRLSISEMQARQAMSRLLRLSLVAGEGGVYRQTGEPLKIENTVSTPATRTFHRELLKKAAEALENDAMEQRDLSSMTFAMDESLVPLARTRIRAFRRKLMAELEAAGKPNRVYHLAVQIFPLSR